MVTFRLLLVAALLALPLWVIQTAPAHACTPPIATPATLADNVRSANLIAMGTLGEMLVLPPESVAHPETLHDGAMPVETKLIVSEYLKGPGPVTPLIYQTAEEISYDAGAISGILTSRSMCSGPPINVGTRYVMFLKQFDTLRYWSAVGTRQFVNDQDVAEYVAQIRAAVAAERVVLPITGTGSGPPHHVAPVVPLAAASALACIGLAANAAFVLYRRG
jgi:hypothetical protein